MLELIERLSLLNGVGGAEAEVADAIIKEIDGHCEWHKDRIGNVICFKKGKKRPSKKVMIDAHTDEVGFIVTSIDDSGLLRFSPVGGIDDRVIFGKSVLVGPDRILGVIGGKAMHMVTADERDKPAPANKLYIDIGLRSREETEKHVKIGEYAVFDSDFVRFGNGMIKGRALDDRAGCAIMIKMIQSELEYDMWFTFTVLEECGGAGAKVASFTVAPDCAIAIETTTAGDLSGVAEDRKVCSVGKGPVVSFMDKGALYDRELYQLAMDTAAAENIPAQPKKGVFGGNNSGSIMPTREGVRCAAISMPCRYLHSPSCVLNVEDIENTLKLVRAFATRVAALD